MKTTFFLFIIFFSLSMWVCLNNSKTDSSLNDFKTYQDGVISHTIQGPLAYRVMMPYAIYFLSDVCRIGSGKLMSLYLNIFLLFALQFSFYNYMRFFSPPGFCLFGTLWLDLAVMMDFTSFPRVHPYETIDVCNLFFMVIALILMYKRNWKWLALVLFISMLNRETPIFLLIPVFLLTYKNKSEWRWMILCAVAVAVPYLGLKMLIHPPQASWAVTDYLNENIPFLEEGYGYAVFQSYVKLVLLIGPAFYLAIFKLKNKNSFLKKVLTIVPFFIPVHIIVGHVEEYRLWIPLFLVLIPLAIKSLEGELRSESR